MADRIEYIDNINRFLSANLENITGKFLLGGLLGWNDPNWKTSDGQNADYLHYLGADGGSWMTRVAITDSTHGPTYNFFSKHSEGNDGNGSQTIMIVDHSRNAKTVSLEFKEVGGNNQYEIKFVIV